MKGLDYRPRCQVVGCGAIILNPYAVQYLWVRSGPRDPGRQIIVCPECLPKFKRNKMKHGGEHG